MYFDVALQCLLMWWTTVLYGLILLCTLVHNIISMHFTSGFTHFLSCHKMRVVLCHSGYVFVISPSMSCVFACLLPMRALGLPHLFGNETYY